MADSFAHTEILVGLMMAGYIIQTTLKS